MIKSYLKLIVLMVGLSLSACVSQPEKPTDAMVLSNINALAIQAQLCLDSEYRRSDNCLLFARQYKNGGFENMELFEDRLAAILKKDLDAGLKATEQIIIIGNAVVFLAQT
ncbi:MAG: hypothetical protein ABNH03_14125 [Alteromonas sp.]|uniref:hypothetical protein n=1 Tax=Alteromonas sp. TaxID=232 RepID=UPI0032D97D82